MGIPFELITMLGSGLLGGVMTLWGQKMKNEAERYERLIDAAKVQGQLFADARKFDKPGVQFTRRFIAVCAVLAIIVWPKVVAVFYPDVLVTIGYSEWNPGFLFFTEGQDVIKWERTAGLVITPLDTHLMSSIIGLYFGASIVKNAR